MFSKITNVCALAAVLLGTGIAAVSAEEPCQEPCNHMKKGAFHDVIIVQPQQMVDCQSGQKSSINGSVTIATTQGSAAVSGENTDQAKCYLSMVIREAFFDTGEKNGDSCTHAYTNGKWYTRTYTAKGCEHHVHLCGLLWLCSHFECAPWNKEPERDSGYNKWDDTICPGPATTPGT